MLSKTKISANVERIFLSIETQKVLEVCFLYKTEDFGFFDEAPPKLELAPNMYLCLNNAASIW